MTKQEVIFAEQLNADKVDIIGDDWLAATFGNHCYGYEIVNGCVSKLPLTQYW